jgi:hypothetical protein
MPTEHQQHLCCLTYDNPRTQDLPLILSGILLIILLSRSQDSPKSNKQETFIIGDAAA